MHIMGYVELMGYKVPRLNMNHGEPAQPLCHLLQMCLISAAVKSDHHIY